MLFITISPAFFAAVTLVSLFHHCHLSTTISTLLPQHHYFTTATSAPLFHHSHLTTILYELFIYTTVVMYVPPLQWLHMCAHIPAAVYTWAKPLPEGHSYTPTTTPAQQTHIDDSPSSNACGANHACSQMDTISTPSILQCHNKQCGLLI